MHEIYTLRHLYHLLRVFGINILFVFWILVGICDIDDGLLLLLLLFIDWLLADGCLRSLLGDVDDVDVDGWDLNLNEVDIVGVLTDLLFENKLRDVLWGSLDSYFWDRCWENCWIGCTLDSWDCWLLLLILDCLLKGFKDLKFLPINDILASFLDFCNKELELLLFNLLFGNRFPSVTIVFLLDFSSDKILCLDLSLSVAEFKADCLFFSSNYTVDYQTMS